MILTIAFACAVSFVLGAFTMGMLNVHKDYQAFRAGYMHGADTDVPMHQLESEVIQAYKKSVENQNR